MDGLDRHRSVSDHNSNAQIEPINSDAVGMGEACLSEIGIAVHLSGPTETSGEKKQDQEELYEYKPYNLDSSSQSDDDSAESLPEGHDGRTLEDGRRSCCTLSDETSSMSETELSNQDDDDVANHDFEAGTTEETFTDLTMDSLNLGIMENCVEEDDLSILPEISTLEISNSDISFDLGDPNDTGSKPQASDNQHMATNSDASKDIARNQSTPGEHCQSVAQEIHGITVGHNQSSDIVSGEFNNVQAPVIFYPGPEMPQPFVYPWPPNNGTDPQGFHNFSTNFIGQHQPVFPDFNAQPMWQQGPHHQHQQWISTQPAYDFPAPNVDTPWPAPTPPCSPLYNHGSYQPTPPFNTSGLLTAEQYYAGQQTPDDAWPDPVQVDADQFQFGIQSDHLGGEDPQHFQYPCVYVSQAGLITVLLKHDVSVEFTVDRTLRLVSHQRELVIASNSRGSASCLYHPHAKVYQDGTTTEVELSDDRRVRMSTEDILVAKGSKCYSFDYTDVQEATPDFRDISKDNSVSLLFGSSGYGPALIPRCLELAQSAHYIHNNDGSFRVRINDISIAQSSRGDVTVVCGPKFLKMAPLSCYLRLQTHFIDMAVYTNAKVFVRRGTHSLDSNPTSMRVGNGNLEAGFEDGDDLSVYRLPRRIPLNGVSRRQKRKSHASAQRKSKYSWYSQ